MAVTQADRLSALPAHRVETVVSSVIFNLIHHKIRLQKVINKAFFKATILNHLVRVPLNPKWLQNLLFAYPLQTACVPQVEALKPVNTLNTQY